MRNEFENQFNVGVEKDDDIFIKDCFIECNGAITNSVDRILATRDEDKHRYFSFLQRGGRYSPDRQWCPESIHILLIKSIHTTTRDIIDGQDCSILKI